MTDAVNWDEVSTLLEDLYRASGRLEALFPGRKFTLDGHLVGSIGEVIAAYIFDLDLVRASSRAHDAIAPDGRRVEVKITQGSSVAIRHEPEHLIVLRRPKPGPVQVVYNGPGTIAWINAGAAGKNGQRPIRIKTLVALDDSLDNFLRNPIKRPAPV